MNERKHLFVASTIYLIFWLIASSFLINGINPDSISYFSISKKYFDGNFNDAINAYWGPLFSWIIIPSFILKIEPHIYARVIFGFISIIFFFLTDKFFIRLNLNQNIRSLGIYFLILPAVFFTFYRLTPDYLLLILTMSYVYVTLDRNYFSNRKQIFSSSVLGFLMFLTKSYGLMFFLSYQTILFLIESFLNKKISKTVLSNYLLSIILFVFLISPWIYLISNKYGQFTISTSGTINIRIVNPELNFRHPPIEIGFVSPSDDNGISAWDDPDLKKYPQWNPLSSFSNFKYILNNTVKNVFKLFVFIFAFAPLLAPLVFFIKKREFGNVTLVQLLLAGLIFGLGYTPIYVENRYIWPSFIFFTITGLYILNSNLLKYFIDTTKYFGLTLILIFSFIPFFIYGISQQLPTTSAYTQAKLIKKDFNISGNFASTNYWDHGLALSYFLNSKFYGTEKKLPINNPDLVEKAKKMGINYIFDYSKNSEIVNGLKFIGKIDTISIYKVIN